MQQDGIGLLGDAHRDALPIGDCSRRDEIGEISPHRLVLRRLLTNACGIGPAGAHGREARGDRGFPHEMILTEGLPEHLIRETAVQTRHARRSRHRAPAPQDERIIRLHERHRLIHPQLRGPARIPRHVQADVRLA